MAQALEQGRLDDAPVDAAERALLEFVRLLTLTAWKTTAEDVEKLRQAGWREEQIGEAVYITALFAFFNRLADAFGLLKPNYRLNPQPGMQRGEPQA